jgi:hypothetical protein
LRFRTPHIGDLAERRAGGRIADGKRRAVGGVAPASGNQRLLAKQI